MQTGVRVRFGVILLVLLALALAPRPLHADRGDAKAQVSFGIRVAQAGLWNEARFRFERATELDPTYAPAWNNLAIVYEQLGELEKARAAYEEALRLAPKNFYVRGNYELFRELHDRATTPACATPSCAGHAK